MKATHRPGTYVCVRTAGLGGGLIRWGTQSHYNHAFVVVSGTELVEADPQGVRLAPLSKYDDCDWISGDYNPVGSKNDLVVIDKAMQLLAAHEQYNWADIARLGLRTFGVQWSWLTREADTERKVICSELVAICGQAAGLNWLCGRPTPAAVTPGDLARRIGK